MIQIRQGKIKDFDQLNKDWAWGDETWAREGQKEYIQGIKAGKQEFWVVQNGDELIGELHLYWDSKDKDEANGENRAYLSALRLHPDHRGQGIGTQLMRRVFKRILEKGYNEVTIGAYKHEPHIRELYKKWGFTETIKQDIEEITGKPVPYILLLKNIAAMPARTVISIYQQLTDAGIATWLDGGWGVDALLGKQTRPHEDLDIVVQEKDLPKLRKLLESQGYQDVPRDDTRTWNFVLGNEHEIEIDIHVINIDKQGNGIYGPPKNGDMYPADALKGKGTIQGQSVQCLTLEYQLESHTGYELQEKDRKDIKALRKKLK